ncbi:MAG: ribosomal protein S18-alanine N-acetyltransferase [Streptosporangiaceae bacterium]
MSEGGWEASGLASGRVRARVRPMGNADLRQVLELERALFPEDAWSEGMFREELARQPESRRYLVAEDDDVLVGYGGLLVVGREADVQTIGVRRSQWGRGVGSALLSGLLHEAVRRGCDDVFLEVRVDNERARAMYERFGFETVDRRRGYYQPSGTDALVMRLSRPESTRAGWEDGDEREARG